METGGIVAAATTSLPEDFGGERNWDYRYCWLRDAALTLSSLISAGATDEARFWRDWLLRAVAGDPADLQIMYTVDGSRRLPEMTLDELPGYAGSRPVRIGNAAVDQKQTDVLGEVMIALEDARESVARATATTRGRCSACWSTTSPTPGRSATTGCGRSAGRSSTSPTRGSWCGPRSTGRSARSNGTACPATSTAGATLRDQVRDEVLTEGYDADRNTFTQHYATQEVDASLLMLPLVGFIDGDDPRMLGTIEAIEQDLMRDGLLLRYRTQTGVDGLAGEEHPFLACSFWLVSAYADAGRLDDAHALFDRLVGLTNDVGLLAEEYDPRGRADGRQLPAGLQPPLLGAGGLQAAGSPRLTAYVGLPLVTVIVVVPCSPWSRRHRGSAPRRSRSRRAGTAPRSRSPWPSTSCRTATCSPSDQDRHRAGRGGPRAPVTVTSIRVVSFFFLIRSGVAVTVTVDASWENGARQADELRVVVGGPELVAAGRAAWRCSCSGCTRSPPTPRR